MTVTENDAEELAIIHDPDYQLPFHIEQHGIDFIPESERWASPRDVFGMWAGASVQMEYFIYGAILMTFGLTFAQVLVVIVVGNLSFLLLGLCSLQGPNVGTTAMAINRAPFGPNGSRPISFFNWITQIGFEVEGLILIVGAGLVLMIKAGFLPGDPAKVVLVIVAVLIQGILPFLGHAAIVKTLRWLVPPFVVLFAVLLGFAVPHANLDVVRSSGDWQSFMEALAFTIALSGLGWTENGNDYTRYCPTDTPRKALVGWVFAGTAVPQILIMTLGRRRRNVRLEDRDRPRRVAPLRPHQRAPAMVRGGLLALRHGPDLRHQQPRHVLVGRDAAGHRGAGEALPGRAHRLRHRLRRDDVRDLQLVLHPVPVGLRRHRHHLDRSVERHLPRRLGPAALPLRARRAAEDRTRLPVLAPGRHLLAGVGRPGARHVRRHLGAVGHLPPADVAEPGDVPHPRRVRLRGGLQRVLRDGRGRSSSTWCWLGRACGCRPTSRSSSCATRVWRRLRARSDRAA